MVDLYLGQLQDIVIGRDFLTWLWFKSENAPDFKGPDGEPFNLTIEERAQAQGGEGEAAETVVVSGPFSALTEAKLGVKAGKKLSSAKIKIEKDGEEWSLSLKADDFALNGVKPPKTGPKEDDDDPDAVFLEKIYLYEFAFDRIDAAFKRFIELRLSAGWTEEAKALGAWLDRA